MDGFLTKKNDLNVELKAELKKGFNKYSKSAEFNFIAGYTISIFPYEFGDYEGLDKKGQEMLKRATELEPNNPIYKMIYLGSQDSTEKNQEEYKKNCKQSELIVRAKYSGIGLLNDYFIQVLIRA